MTDNLNLKNNKIINLSQGTSNTDGVNKEQMDIALNQKNNTVDVFKNYVSKNSPEVKANLNMDNNKITGLSNSITNDTDGVNKKYVHDKMKHNITPHILLKMFFNI